jgi:hypothetical protein
MENATKATLSNVGREAVHVLNNTASQFASHSSTIESASLSVLAVSAGHTWPTLYSLNELIVRV